MNNTKTHPLPSFASVALLLFLGTLLAAPCFSQESSNEETNELSTFRLIYERNIFNPNREKEIEQPVVEVKPQADEISLVGTLVTETQRFAFFDGSSSSYRRVLTVGAEIGGGVIQAIEISSLHLRFGDEEMVLPVGKGLAREEGQPWRLQDAPRRVELKPKNDGPKEQPTPATDLLRRLMEKRNQEQSQ
ncbi:MAG: hypothetical protein P9L94_04750 [Candidatus Hinthialibacter antarcticus]|nr:hypothetical protein [Candidatus Hinthialibacter antarcticus]